MSTSNNATATASVQLGNGVTKKYTLMSALPTGTRPGQIPIVKCSQMLENRMQCWRAGDFLIEVTTTTTDETGTATRVESYQKCRAHAQQERDADELQIKESQAAAQQAAQAEATAETLPEIETRSDLVEQNIPPTAAAQTTTQSTQTAASPTKFTPA